MILNSLVTITLQIINYYFQLLFLQVEHGPDMVLDHEASLLAILKQITSLKVRKSLPKYLNQVVQKMFRRIIYLRYNAGKIFKINLQNFEEKCDLARFSANVTNLPKNQIHSVLPPWDQGGDDFCVISLAGGQLLNFKSQSGDTLRGGR